VIRTETIDSSVQELIEAKANTLGPAVDKLDSNQEALIDVNSSVLEQVATESGFSEDFVLLGGEISPSKSLIGESGVNLHDFEVIGLNTVDVKDNEFSDAGEIEKLLSENGDTGGK
jgi:hypothetical protein